MLFSFAWHIFVGLSYVAWDNDVYYYQQIALAFKNGQWWEAFNHYAPTLLGWIWGVLGASNGPLIVVFQAFISVLMFVPLLRLARNIDEGIKPWILLVFVGFQSSMMRYGMQPLPDMLFLLFHLFVLAELSAAKLRAHWLIAVVLLLSWTRYDAFLFYGIYFLWAFVMSAERKQAIRVLILAVLVSLSSLSLTSYLRYESFIPTNRFCSLYSKVGEDQLVKGQTLWHELAIQGQLASEFSEVEIQEALQVKNRRESENASSATGIFQNFWGLVVWPGKLWEGKQCGLLILLLSLLALWKAPKKIYYLVVLILMSIVIYSFLGVKERYLFFSTPLVMMLAARGIGRLQLKWLLVLLLCFWLGDQLRRGSYHYRQPEVQLKEHRLAGEWIRDHGKKKGPILAREAVASIYGERRWRRLPTSNSYEELMEYARAEGVSYLVLGSRYFLKKRPWQKFLLDKSQKHAVFTGTVGEYKVFVMEIPKSQKD